MTKSQERILELLADQATDHLEHNDAVVLAALLARHPDYDDDSMSLAAAAMDLAMTEPTTQNMPADLERNIRNDAALFFKTLEEAGDGPADPIPFPTRQPEPKASGNWLAWAAAAVFLIAAVLGWQRPSEQDPVVEPLAQPTVGERYAALESQGVVLTMSATEDPAADGASGSLVWNADLQEGYMRISGLEANDPTITQYQLWIFDKDGDERYPIDGGVFDIPAGTDPAIIPIDAKIAANNPTLYAITVEKPGGVVVSSRERIVMVAQPAG